jgi:hypothetical protein
MKMNRKALLILLSAFLAFGCYLAPEDAEETELELILPKSIFDKDKPDKYVARIELKQNGETVPIHGRPVYEVKLKKFKNKKNDKIKLNGIREGENYIIILEVGIRNPGWIREWHGISDPFLVQKKEKTEVYIQLEAD